MQKKSKKKWIIGGVVLVAAAAIGAASWFFYFRNNTSASSTSADAVYVDSVGMLTGLTSTGTVNRFAGVIEPQKTVKIKLKSEKTVAECYVKVGDNVKKGDKLFIYDTTDDEDSLTSKEIDLDRIKSDIETGNANVEQLKKDKANASADDQLSYSVQIQSAENTVKKNEYELKTTEAGIEQLKKTIKNAVVTSEIDGVVKSITDTTSDTASYSSDDSETYMTLLSTGRYRVKGTINEQNMQSLTQGDAVIVHSRVDESVTWTGIVDSIDTENAEASTASDYMSSSSSSDTTSSNYPFYIELDDDEGLMLGQHVYIERDEGQSEAKTGMWLSSYYIVQDDAGNAYVWASTSKDKLEKRTVTLGDYDEDLDEYEIKDGLTEDDYIAFPDDTFVEGQATTKNIEQATSSFTDGEALDGATMDGMTLDGESLDEGSYDEGLDEGSYDESLDTESFDESLDEENYDDEDGVSMGAMEAGDEPTGN